LTAQLNPVPDAVVVGRLRREFLLPASAPERVNQPGGNLSYAAMAALQWGAGVGMVSRVNSTFPAEWLERYKSLGVDLAGVQVSGETIDDRFFVAYTNAHQPKFENPIAFFAERQLPFPAELFNYKPTQPIYCSKTNYKPDTIRVTDIPPHFLEASAAHICPIDFVSHKILPSVLKGGLVLTLSMRAANCYMDPIFWEEIRGLITDVTAFMITEAQGLRLFQGRSVDLWEIAEILAGYGPEYILVHAKDGSVMIYSRLDRGRWVIPAYPARISDPTGMLDAFDGGFIANYRKSYDVVQAALCGAVSASFCVEGSGPFYLLEDLPGLKEARLKVLEIQVTEP
jgi:sugar/nucleoside kinase (ribokinase family)